MEVNINALGKRLEAPEFNVQTAQAPSSSALGSTFMDQLAAYLGRTAGTWQQDLEQQFLQSRRALTEFAAELPVVQQSFRGASYAALAAGFITRRHLTFGVGQVERTWRGSRHWQRANTRRLNRRTAGRLVVSSGTTGRDGNF